MHRKSIRSSIPLVVLASLALALGACGTSSSSGGGGVGGGSSGGSSGGGAGTTADYDKMSQQAGDAMCALMVKCQASLSFISFATTAGCSSFLGSPGGSDSSERDAIASGKATFDKGKASTCLAAINALSCAALDNGLPSAFVSVAAKCESVVTGTLPEGQACAHQSACVSRWCKPDAAKPGCPGTCTARLGKDAACDTQQPCTTGLVCRGGKCSDKLEGADGDACGSEAPCAAGLQCGESGKCGAAPGLGEACGQAQCAKGLTCDQVAGKCVTAKKAGESCTAGPLGTSDCEAPLACNAGKCGAPKKIGEQCTDAKECFGIDAECKGGTCTAIPISAKGGPCRPADMAAGTLFAFGCQAGLECDKATKTCGDPPAAGQPCDGKCAGDAACVNDGSGGKCVAPVADGGACGNTGEGDCAKGLICQQNKCGAPKCE